MQRSGFTVVELLITLVIMAILLTLGVAGMFQLQANARDEERKSDIAAIAQGLEQRYKLGNPVATYSGVDNDVQKGSYPGTNEGLHYTGFSRTGYTPETVENGYITEALVGTSTSTFTNPADENAWTIVCVFACAAAEDASQIQNAFGSPVNDKYVYEPVDRNGNVCCCGDCVSYNLYWISETDQTPYKGINGLKVVRSTHQ